MKIAVMIGSLRRESYARKIANNILTYFPEGFEPEIVEIGHLPLYNCDFDDPNVTDINPPESYEEFREKIKSCAGVFFVTAENNRTIPAVLKNAVDIGSKPMGGVAWKNKPVGIVSHSVGRMGGYSSQKNLRLALSYFDMPSLGQPEVFLGQSPSLFEGGDGNQITNESTVKFLQDYVDRFCELVKQHQ